VRRRDLLAGAVAAVAAPAAGLVQNLARPGANVPGIGTFNMDLEEKRLSLLAEPVPDLSRVAVLSTSPNSYTTPAVATLRRAAELLRLELE